VDTRRRIDAPIAADTRSGRGRRMAFRVVSWITALWILAVSFFGLMEVILMWMPESSVGSIVGEDPTLPPIALHRTHFMAIGIVAWIVVLAVLVQLRKPERRVAAMLQLLVAAVGGTIVYGLSGTLVEWFVEEWTILVPVAAMAVLHPRARELFARPRFDRTMLVVGALGALPWFVYAVHNARRQLVGSNLDPHYTLEHWAVAALMGLLIGACALIGSTDKSGWRLPAWVAAIASAVFGIHALTYGGLASGLTTPWAACAIGWGVAFALAIVFRSGRRVDSGAVG
jgi:tetrahydromethanopterin S-methyltransferase subunit C